MKFSARLITAGLLLLFGASVGVAQEVYPSRLIKIVVPTPPGGLTDVIARVVAQKFTEAWGQTVIIENRPGGDELLAGEVVARAPPDGYALLMASNGGITSSPQLHKDKRFDPIKDLTPIFMLGQITPVVMVPSTLPVTSVKELIDLAKSKPGQLNFGSFGTGSYSHVAMEDFKKRTGTEMMHVPYRGAPPAYTALIRSEISALITNLSGAMVHVNSGAAKVIAAAGPKRSTFRPDLPTVAETVPGFSAGAWWGIFGPANLPQPILEKIRAELTKALTTDEMKKLFETNTVEPIAMTQPQFVQFINDDQAHWARQFKEAGLKPE
jgi:tripartite-type tricarboxylate transporter receptor subunit TctC